ncbi:MAG: cell division protein FtsA [Tidjanibacter sp.]|nr:cell division protein FtsA [Tidjanibacter sp.]
MELKDYIVSIDLGCSKVVAALGTLDDNGNVVVADFVCKPMSGFTRGEISNIESVSKALKSAVSELESRNNIIVSDVLVSVEGRHVVCADNSGFVYIGSDGEILDENVRQLHENMNNVQAPEGMTILSRIPQRYKIDSKEITSDPVGMYGKQLEATFSFLLAGKGVLERIGKAFDRVGINGYKFYAAASATGEVVASEDEKEMGVAVIDLGAGVTNVAIYHDKVLRYAVSIPMGQEAINKDIKATAIPDKHIEKLKIAYGYATASAIPFNNLNSVIRINGRTQHEKHKDIPYRDLCTIINARMLDIIEFVVDEIRTSGYQNKLGAGIILTGGGSQLKGVVDLFKERTGYEVRLGYAEVGVGGESVEGTFTPAMSTAVGLLTVGLSESMVRTAKSAPKKVTAPESGSTGQEDEKTSTTKGNKKEKKDKEGKRRNFWEKLGELFFGPDQEVVEDENL